MAFSRAKSGCCFLNPTGLGSRQTRARILILEELERSSSSEPMSIIIAQLQRCLASNVPIPPGYRFRLAMAILMPVRGFPPES